MLKNSNNNSNNFRNEAERQYLEQMLSKNKVDIIEENQTLRKELISIQSIIDEHFQGCSYCELCQKLGFVTTMRL